MYGRFSLYFNLFIRKIKNTVKLNESQLRKIVAESVKKVLKETAIRGID